MHPLEPILLVSQMEGRQVGLVGYVVTDGASVAQPMGAPRLRPVHAQTRGLDSMKKYIPSVRDVHGLTRTPVLAEANLSGEWIPPMEVYIAADVDAEIRKLCALIGRVIEWEPALPVESSLLDELAASLTAVSCEHGYPKRPIAFAGSATAEGK
jgi:hypothetical protein